MAARDLASPLIRACPHFTPRSSGPSLPRSEKACFSSIMVHGDANPGAVEGDRRQQDQLEPEPPQPEEYLVKPTQLFAHHKMLSEASVLQPHLELLKQELVRYQAHAEGFLTSVQEFMVSSAVPLEYTWSSAAPTTPAAAAAASAPAGATTTSPDAHIAALRLAVAGGSATSATIAAGAAAEGAMLLTAARDPEAVPVPAPVAPLPPQHAALFRYEVQRDACRATQSGLGAALKERLLPALDLWLGMYEHCKEQLPRVERLRRQHDAANIQLQEAVIAAAARAVTRIAAQATTQDMPAAAAAAGGSAEEGHEVVDTSLPAAEKPAEAAEAAAEGHDAGAGLSEDDMVEVAAAARKDLDVLASAVHMAAAAGRPTGGAPDARDMPGDGASVSPGVTITPRTTSNPHLATSTAPDAGTTSSTSSTRQRAQGPAAEEQAEEPRVAAASLMVAGSGGGGVVGGRLQVVTAGGDVALEWEALEPEDQERLRQREGLLAGLASVLLPQQETMYQELCWLVSAGAGLKGWTAHLLQAALTAAGARKLPLELLQPFPDHLIMKEPVGGQSSKA